MIEHSINMKARDAAGGSTSLACAGREKVAKDAIIIIKATDC